VLMRKLGKKQLVVSLRRPLAALPDALGTMAVELSGDAMTLTYTFDTQQEETGIAGLLRVLNDQGIDFKDLRTSESSLEDIFVSLVRKPQEAST